MTASADRPAAQTSTHAGSEPVATRAGLRGLTFRRLFTDGVTHPFDAIEWELRTAAITNDKGEVFFEQKDVEVPKSWSMTATNIVTQKYFSGKAGTPERERSVRQLIGRVVETITGFGSKGGYFRTAADRDAFRDELTAILVNQAASFNSPVWFNVGVEEKPQASACFINAVGDSMGSILDLAKTEGMLFKFGSGTGSNLSSLRSSTECLSSGGIASGPVSFMKGFDSFAGAIKSGGKTRRAAKMVILNVDHPDVLEFIDCKAKEERKAWDLIEAGWDGSFGGEVYNNVLFQNANHTVRVTDEFMQAVEAGRDVRLPRRDDGRAAHAATTPAVGPAPHVGGRLDLRRPGDPVRHDDQPLEPVQGDAPDQRVATPARSTCSSTTPRATSPR